LLGGLAGLGGGTAGVFLNGLYWCALPLLGALTGCLVLARWQRERQLAPLCAMAVFYGLVGLFNQIAIYFYYTTALSLAALLLLSSRRRASRVTMALFSTFLMVVALVFHAAQPLSRGFLGTIEGRRIALVPSPLDRCHLFIDPTDLADYRAVVDLVRAKTSPDDTIFVLPNHPELYFLTGRRNPFRFYSTALGILDPEELKQTLAHLREVRPRLIIDAPGDKNRTPFAAELMRAMTPAYVEAAKIGPFEVYEPSPSGRTR
jgi:hypothetical protein